jgi:hypothetical protein
VGKADRCMMQDRGKGEKWRKGGKGEDGQTGQRRGGASGAKEFRE